MISGTLVGFICMLALVAAAGVLVWLDQRTSGAAAHTGGRAPVLGRIALTMLIIAFIGGAVLAIQGGIAPRADHPPLMGGMPPSSGMGGPMPGAVTIGTVNPEELRALIAKVQSDPKDVAARERLGHLYLQQQDFEKVFAMAHEALQLDPKSVESRVHMAVVMYASQDLVGGQAQLEKALAIDPNNVEALRFKKMFSLAK